MSTTTGIDQDSPTVKELRIAALFYAWGQQDAGIGTHVEAWRFGLHYRELAQQYESGALWYRQSIQDAWKSYQVEGEK